MQSGELLTLLRTSDHAEQRRFAALELADSAPMTEDVIQALAQSLCDEDKGVRDVCAFALRTHDDAGIKAHYIAPLIVHERIEVRNLAGEVLIQLGAPAADALLPYMSDANPDNRKFACDIIALLDNTSAHVMQSVIALLHDPDENVLTAGIDALGRLGTPEYTDALIALYEQDHELGPYIIQTLGQIGGELAQEFLLSLLATADEFIQIAAIDALALCGTHVELALRMLAEIPQASEAVQTIMLRTVFGLAYRLNEHIELPAELRSVAQRAMQDDDEEIRIAGLFAISSTGTIESSDIPAIIYFLQHSDESLQRHILSLVLSSTDLSVVAEFTRAFIALIDIDRPELQDIPALLPDLWHETSEPVRECVLSSIDTSIDSIGDVGKYRILLILPALDNDLYERLRSRLTDSSQPVEQTDNRQ